MLQQVSDLNRPVENASTESPFQRVVLAIDFGSASLGAARWATAHVARRAHAILSQVIPSPGETAYEDGGGDDVLSALGAGLGGFAATLDLASTRTVLRAGRPSHWLSTTANGAEASLVVLGRRGDANRKRIGEPNVIERLSRRTSASVLVVPEGTIEPPRHVIAAVDESRAAAGVVRIARQLARLNRCPITLLHVRSPAIGEYDRVIQSGRNMLTGARKGRVTPRSASWTGRETRIPRWIEALAVTAGEPGAAHVRVVVGDPAREIAAFAFAGGAPLLVVGKRGADGAPPGSLGSVARELLTRAPLPVLAVSDV